MQRVFMSLGLAIACGIAVQDAASSKEYRGTWQQQTACTSDVWRLCGAHVPDVDRIVACLRRNTSQLSGGCRAVFEQRAADSRNRDNQLKGYDRQYRPRHYEGDYGDDRNYRRRPYEDDDE